MCLLFEPSPENYALLKKNLTANGYTWAHCINAAISNEKRDYVLMNITRDAATNTIAAETPYSIQKINVKAMQLDDVIEVNNIARVDLLKVDVEGAEGIVLNSAKKAIFSSKVPLVLCEYHPSNLLYGFNTPPQDFLLEVKSLGYTIYRIENGIETLYTEPTPDFNQRYHLAFRQKQ